ncbi:hypothetical protein FB45DRAFT_401186 [Roridomyces roridus]|uniref:Uncharacterized protein n=1 Tax=Roridomyces roridus TaxID=1738132 RepID=A0AAD7C3Y2_9AGAR|nr:hypothetical protein FB45DRAFT_401186 [Roridomyces roridus]
MASPQRLRNKTSDITDFFSRASSSSNKLRPLEADQMGGPSSVSFLSDPESPARRRSTKIPFLGRQRKKSTQSDASASSAGPSSGISDSEMLSPNSKDKQPRSDTPSIPSLDDLSERPLPALPPKSYPAQSLGSRLAAHLAPSRTKLLNLSPRKPPPPPRSPANEYIPSPTPSSRPTSVDSNSSENRSTTPRPTQPTITVSLPPDNLEGYEGMFTLPASGPSDAAEPPTPPTPTLQFPTRGSDAQPRSHDGDSTIKRRGSRATAEERSPSRSSRIARKHVGSAFKHSEVDSTDAEDSEAVMSDSPQPSAPMIVGPTGTAEKRRTLASMPYNFAEKVVQPRSIMKPTTDRLPRPPVFPVPPPPSNPPSSALPGIPFSQSRKATGSTLPGPSSRRPRAQTLSAIAPSITISPAPTAPSTVPSRRFTKSIGESSSPAAAFARKVTEESAGKANLDMSADQLRQALALRNQQFDELASYLLKITEAHVAEQHALLKKIATLEQEATRKDNEIKGLTWLVTNNARPGSSGKNTSTESGPAKPKPSAAEDSGAESPQTTSGAEESMWGSDSGGESLSKNKTSHPFMSSFYRPSAKSSRPEGSRSAIPASSSTNRSSISSFGTSPSSSTSSLSLNHGAITPATTVISLSAIPETAASEARHPDPVVAAAILAAENQREKQERRAKRNSNRVSSSSLPTPAASYSANLKRGRPPSIAQVLAQSPKMEHGRDKQRSYGTSGSASS